MICSSENRFFTSNRRRLGDWTPNRRATQNRGGASTPLRTKHAYDCILETQFHPAIFNSLLGAPRDTGHVSDSLEHVASCGNAHS